eukprot:gene29431-3936_t
MRKAGEFSGNPASDEYVVTLRRSYHEEELPWGLVLHNATMKLTSAPVGGIAHQSEQLRGCVGMSLTHANGCAVAHPRE